MWITSIFRSISGVRRQRPALVAMLVLLLVSTSLSYASPVEELAAEGDAAYRQGNYLRAIDTYNRVITGGYISGPLLYNLANAHFKAGNLGESILWYERAKKLMPNSRDLRYNLEIAKSKTVDRIEKPPRLPIWNLVDTLRDLLSHRALAAFAWTAALLSAVLFAMRLLLTRPGWAKPLRGLLTASLVLLVVALALVGLRIAADHGDDMAVILVDKVSLYAAPDETSVELLALHEGTTVTVVKQLDSWMEVRLEDGRQGWMPQNAGELVSAVSLP